MYFKLCLLLILGFGPLQAGAISCGKLLEIRINTKKITSRNFKDSVQYLDHAGLRIPFVDLMPTTKSNGKTIFLASGFSKNMRAWLPHMRLLNSQGYRVVSFDQSNVGYNLKENGILKLDKGTGLDIDAVFAFEVLKHVGVYQGLTVLGHSRGAAIASRLSLFAVNAGIQVDQLHLFTPYVRYLWATPNPISAFNESVYDSFAELYPHYYGQFLRDSSKKKKYETVEGLDSTTEEAALVFILKGVKLGSDPEVTTGDLLGTIVAKGKDIPIKAYAAEHDSRLAPPEIIKELEQEGVEYKLLEGKTKDHYWPLHYAESMLKAAGLL